MPDNPPPPSPAQDDDIHTIHVNFQSCYLKPAGSVEPQLPDGTFSFDAQEDHWKPSLNDPKRQRFRIQCKNEIVFIAGAQYTYKPNTSLYIKCKKATFMPHPTDPSQKTVTVRMPGADAEQSLLAKAGEGNSGTKANFRFKPLNGPTKILSLWQNEITLIDGAIRGGDGVDGTIGLQGADAGSLTIEADKYDTSALTDDEAFFFAECMGGKGQQGGDGGDGGSGGNGLNAPEVDSGGYIYVMNDDGFFGKMMGGSNWKAWSDSRYQDLVVKCFLGAKGGTAGRQGAGGYGGSGGQFTVNLPKESAGDDKLKSRFGVQSNVGTQGTPGAPGNPGSGGRHGDSWLFKSPTSISKDNLESELRSKLQLDWSSDTVKQWVKYLVSGTEPSTVNGDAAIALDEQEIQNRRADAGQHKPTTSPNVVFNEAN